MQRPFDVTSSVHSKRLAISARFDARIDASIRYNRREDCRITDRLTNNVVFDLSIYIYISISDVVYNDVVYTEYRWRLFAVLYAEKHTGLALLEVKVNANQMRTIQRHGGMDKGRKDKRRTETPS